MTERQKQFRRNQELETLLYELNNLLEPVENGILRNHSAPQLPLILIVGSARSGSTLAMQWLASTGNFAYPTNLLSRFYAAPYIGAKIQEMLTNPKYNFRDEFKDFDSSISFDSALGKTRGILAPNEFFYFWRRFFHYEDIQYLDESSLSKIDVSRFRAELAAIESVFEKPLAMKGLFINWNISFIHKVLPNTIFLHVKRDPLYNAQSLIEAREHFYGDRNAWYSFKPLEFPTLKDLTPYEQVAGQVYYTNRAIENELSKIDKKNWMQIKYEQFCLSPEKYYQMLREKLALHKFDLSLNYLGPKYFNSTNQVRLPSRDFNLIREAYETFLENGK
ncbi:MAG: sulfotransferase [Candidatus Nitrosomaritimum yanchengensis]